MSLNGQEFEIKQYSEDLKEARKKTIRYGMIAAFFYGLWFFALFAEYGFGYWIGAQILKDSRWNHNAGRDYNVNDIIGIFFSVLASGWALFQLGPSLQSISKARESGHHIYSLLRTSR